MHVHWHRTVHAYAQWRLSECRCGSRRTVRLVRYGGGYSALVYGWPPPDGRAHPPPAGGWLTGQRPLPTLPRGPAPGAQKGGGSTRH